ncbi:toll-like receptor 13 [Anopheles albimanus]|uniref:toll-like receptor 13 n=1 Tax=Anopheles albimanus TaxID=7167 RepID=UPI00163E6D1E|nr:toll-like receptor 13 [Anopheles albimanus]
MQSRRYPSVALVAAILLAAVSPLRCDECVATKRDRHRSVMEEFRHSPNWGGVLTEDTLNLQNNETEIDLSKQGFKEVHWHLSSIPTEGYEIYDLNLAYNNFEELNELTFLRFYSLESLNLSNNRLQTVTNLTFGSLIRLVELDLSFNLIHTLEKQAFDRLYGLESLSLRENCLVTLAPNQFHFNDHLSTLLLDHNQLAFLPPVLFDPITMVDELYELDLSNNNLRRMPHLETKEISLLKLDNNHIETLTLNKSLNVRVLQVQNNNLYDVDLFKFSRTEHIDLSHNNVENIVGLHEMQMLEYLDLSSNNVSKFDYSLKYSIRTISSLITLRLQNCSLSEHNIEGLLASESIMNLDLSQNNFIRLNVTHLSRLRALVYLSLNFNYLRELVDYERMRHEFPYLELVSLSFNRWNCSYYDQLNAYLNYSHIRSTSDARDCYVNGTHVADSFITDVFEPLYTMNHVKRDMAVLRNLGRNTIYFLYALFSTTRAQANATLSNQQRFDHQLHSLEHDVDRLLGMLAFLVTIFAVLLLVVIVYGCHWSVRRWQHDRAVKVVTYNKRANEFSNGVTVNEVVQDNVSVA